MRDENLSAELAVFGAFVGGLGGRRGDAGSPFPASDSLDFAKGVHFVPGQVTDARRNGEKVNFIQECGPNCWYWEMPDGSRIYHFDRPTYDRIGQSNGKVLEEGEYGARTFKDGPGACPNCGNEHTNGGVVPAPTATP